MNKKIIIGVLSGGISEERYLSIWAGDYVCGLLAECGFTCIRIDWVAMNKWKAYTDTGTELGNSIGLQSLLAKIHCHCIINLFCGKEEIFYKPSLAVNAADIPYIGNSWQSSFTGSDKITVKRICKDFGLPIIPAELLLPKSDILASVLQHVEFPCFIKPVTSGSSIGTALVKNINEGIFFLSTVQDTYYPLIIEKKITGKEYCCGVVYDPATNAPSVTAAAEILYNSPYFDAQTKASGSYQVMVNPPSLPPDTAEKMRYYAYTLHNAIGADFSTRTDFIVDIEGDVHVLEINTHPGMSAHSILPRLIEEKYNSVAVYLQDLVYNMLNKKKP